MGPTNKNLCLKRNQTIYFCGLLQKQKQPQKQTLLFKIEVALLFREERKKERT
jgi:hypothetical protein